MFADKLRFILGGCTSFGAALIGGGESFDTDFSIGGT
jgi:hypothetical protein